MNDAGSRREWQEAPVTWGVIGVNVAVWLWQSRLTGYRAEEFFQMYALTPGSVLHGAWWQLVTFQFLHGGVVHLFMNLFVLQSLGPTLEWLLGKWRALALYLFSGLFGGLVQLGGAIVAPDLFNTSVVGASAGISGVLAAICAWQADNRIDVRLFFVIPLTLKAKHLLLLVALVSVVGIVYPFGRIAHLAHFGGLIGGLVGMNLFGAGVAWRRR